MTTVHCQKEFEWQSITPWFSQHDTDSREMIVGSYFSHERFYFVILRCDGWFISLAKNQVLWIFKRDFIFMKRDFTDKRLLNSHFYISLISLARGYWPYILKDVLFYDQKYHQFRVCSMYHYEMFLNITWYFFNIQHMWITKFIV